MHDRVGRERHGAVSGDAARDELDAAPALLEHLDGGVLHLAADAGRTSAFGEAVLGLDPGELLLGDVADPHARVPFLPDSARKMTSRSSGTLRRLRSSIVMSPAVTLSLSSTAPRP
jgi:hypothetical protein